MSDVSFSEEKADEIDQLKNDIKEAFKDLDPPESTNIALHECEECAGVRQAFANLRWQELDEDFLKENFGVIPLFSPEAFRYYLPAYLLYTLENFDDKYSEICEFTLYAITPDNGLMD